MYVSLLLVLVALGLWTAIRGWRRRSAARCATGAALVLSALALIGLLEFWAEMLWFESMGYASRFWVLVWTRVQTVAIGTALGWIAVVLLTRSLRRSGRIARIWPAALGALGGATWGWGAWEELLLFRNGAPTGVAEPVLGRDASFYLFQLPFYDQIYALLFWIAAVVVVATLASVFLRPTAAGAALRLPRPEESGRVVPLLVNGVFAALVLAVGNVLAVFHLLYSDWGVVAGPGWTDAHVRLPAYWIVAAVTVALACLPLAPAFGRRIGARVVRTVPALGGVAVAWGAIAVTWFLGLVAVPSLVQWLVVEPNEITFEKPYIAHNIDFTRRGFRLHEVEDKSFPAAEEMAPSMAARNRDLLSEVRLWDYRALASVYKQFQEIRLYYEFHDVDLDRYELGDRYRQVMVSARELQQANLPPQSQTFVNRRFKYTHGYGLTLATVSDFTRDGLPNLLVKDIPPRATLPELEVARPEIYYGELTRAPAVVNTTEAEFDHPSGDENVYSRYSGGGGVHLKNLWRKFVFGWILDGTRFLLSTYPTPDTRVMIHRQIRRRVAMLAPFLEFDGDPYVVLAQGRLYWIVDAYTTSTYYPYSEPFSSREDIELAEQTDGVGAVVQGRLDGSNYVRNSVKAVVDAFEGEVDFYVFEPEDPLVRAWSSAFPDLFKAREEMPAELRAHVRYPVDFLLAQGLVYAKYHMTDPEVFYNQEDLWVRATEKYYADVQPVEPYYVMWEAPSSDRPEFVLMLPFTPKKRQVLIGWIAGLCDGENYGRFLAYKFPKEKRVFGPQQVETKIDQDRFLSGQLTLWDQRGSNVIRGNVLALPIEDTLLYVEPIYLQAETAAYPELRLVVVMQGDRMSYAETFEEALRGLFSEVERAPVETDEHGAELFDERARRAEEAFEGYLKALGEERFRDAADELERLGNLLRSLSGSDEAPHGRN